MLKAGFSKVCISPNIGAPLAGFAARKEVSTGIHDDLFARALVIGNDESAVAFISVDVLALPSEFVRGVRDEIRESIGLSADSVMIASTHTHAGPVTIKTFFNPNESVDSDYMNALGRSIRESVEAAWGARFPARVGVGTGHVEGVGVNRRSVDQRPVDKEIGIIKVEDPDGNTRAILINYACHPTVLGPDNLLVSGDFPTFAIKEIEAGIGPNSFAMFVNGTQGNISMGHSSELSAIGVITPGRTFERAAELGHLLADATIAALPAIGTGSSTEIAAVRLAVNLPLKEYAPLDETARRLAEADELLAKLEKQGAQPAELMPAMTNRLYASITDFYAREARSLSNAHLPIELQGVRVGDAMFVAVPAEVFVEIGLDLKQRASNKIFIVGIANGYIGYLPTREAFKTGGYEVVSSKCAADAEDTLIAEAIKLGKILFEPNGNEDRNSAAD